MADNREEEILEELEEARSKYPRVVIELPTSEELLEWLADMEKKGRKKHADEILKLWEKQFDKWKKRDRDGNPGWGDPNWAEEDAWRRAGAYARGYFHYRRGGEKRKELSQKLKDMFVEDFEEYKKKETATEKRNFIKSLEEKEKKANFSAYSHASRVETRGMDLMKFAGIGAAAKPNPPPPPPPPGGDDNRPILTVNVSPEGGGRTTPRDGEAHDYPYGTSVIIQQKANRGYTFSHWELDSQRVDGNELPINMNNNHTVFAIFEGGGDEDSGTFLHGAVNFEQPDGSLEPLEGAIVTIREVEGNVKKRTSTGSSTDLTELQKHGIAPGGGHYAIFGLTPGRYECIAYHPHYRQKLSEDKAVVDITIGENNYTFILKRGEGEEKANLIVDSIPFPRVRVNVHQNNVQVSGGSTSLTPLSINVQKNNTYTVSVPEKVVDPKSKQVFHFLEWEDGSKQAAIHGVISRLVYISEPTRLVAKYDALTLTVDSRPVRGVKVEIDDGSGKRAMQPRGVTRAREYVEEGKTYTVEVPGTFLAPDGKTYTFEKWEDDSKNTNRQVLIEDESKTVTAHYKEPEQIRHKQRPVTGSPYRSGMQRPSDRLTSALGMSGLKGRIGRDVKTRELRKDPHVLAAINKGKRILNKYGRIEYTRIFGFFRQEWKDEKKKLVTTIKNKKNDISRAKSTLKIAKKTLNNIKKSDPRYAAALVTFKQASDSLLQFRRELIDLNIDFEKRFSSDLENRSASLAGILDKRSKAISVTVCRRFQIPLNSDDEIAVTTELAAYAKDLAQQFAIRGRTIRHALMRGFGNLSRGTETFGAAGMNVFYNTFDFIFGPWTITTIFVLIEFFFVLNYIGYNTVYLWVFPLIGAGFTFLLNFSDSFRPLDWVTHLSSGAIIGYSALMLLIALGALNWSFMSPIWFWIIWGILGFLGLFQFYQTSGWKVVMQGGVIVLLFAFIALGPYSAYYQQALDQVKAPVEIAYRAVSNAVTDVWLLATNPTEWYARQQLVNVRPERPLDFPKGIEVLLLDALPPSVPGGTEFALTAVIKNEGSIKEPARDITVTLGCNQWCDKPPEPDIAQNKYALCQEKGLLGLGASTNLRNSYYCAESCGSDIKAPGTPAGIDDCIKSCIGSESTANVCVTKNKAEFLSNYAFINKMERGEATAVTIRGFTAVSEEGRQGEVRLADVLFNLSYRYSTSTSLLTEVMTEKEINRRIQENENVYRNVPSVTKSSPAQLSLNVGPQPLRAGGQSLLLVSVSNTRDDSSVLLKRGTKINITMPKIVGSGLNCGNSRITEDSAERQVVEYTVPEDATVLAYNFRSIFAFLCDFRVADEAAIGDVKTGLITAEMPGYTFVLTKKKQVPVTPPLGIVQDPYEYKCNKCGTQEITGPVTTVMSAFDRCTADECHGISNPSKKGICYYEYAGTQGSYVSPQVLFGNPCHSCGREPTCDKFITQKSCEGVPGDTVVESELCGLSCEWDTNAKRPSTVGEINPNFMRGHLDPTTGTCKEKVVAGVSLSGTRTTGTSTGQCDAIPANFKSGYEKYKDRIATAVDVWDLDQHIKDTPDAAVALVAAVISQESGWNEKSYNPSDPSWGLMGITIDLHPECAGLGDVKNDPVANIKCGVRILSDLAKRPDIATPRAYPCTPQGSAGYANINAILRYYNGWPPACDLGTANCCNKGDPDYVENVRFRNGHLQDWLDCFTSTRMARPSP